MQLLHNLLLPPSGVILQKVFGDSHGLEFLPSIIWKPPVLFIAMYYEQLNKVGFYFLLKIIG